jgi:cell division septum initiation protein DivIVA
VELKDKLEEIVAQIESARAMPMSASCIVNRGQILGLLDELRDLIPAEMQRAESLLEERDDVVAEGRREAERIIEDAHDERARLIGETQVHQAAVAEATRVREEAEAEARQMRQEVDDYVDTKLANFEIVLNKTLAAVLRGREKLHGRHEMAQLADARYDDEEPLPGA